MVSTVLCVKHMNRVSNPFWNTARPGTSGSNKVLDAFTFIFKENQDGLFQVHSYPFNGTTSTFIIECDEVSWLNAGLDKADEAQSIAYCQQLLEDNLGVPRLLSNNSK